ncbi:teneurin-4-like [Bufo gargarizans]|uniref:teneurin-4-like n=1 Tax=Bufo gargarizans TaxID=30331 RepID=UPI001CF2A334|nr:teneurin-4-like [Bufo gargarizans]
MDVKERKPYRSLTRRCDTDRRYTSSSADSDESKIQPKSYSSSETLKAYDQDSRLSYSNRVKEMVHQEVDEFCRTGGSFTLQELGLGEVTPPHGTLYRTDIGLPHCGYSMTGENDADNEADCVLSPEQPVRLWTRNAKSGRSSCLSSRANSNLTLTDTEHENTENDLQDVELMNPALEQCFPTTVLGDSQPFQFSGYTHRSTGRSNCAKERSAATRWTDIQNINSYCSIINKARWRQVPSHTLQLICNTSCESYPPSSHILVESHIINIAYGEDATINK